MGAFEYLSVLISIILALGMTRVLAGVGEMLQARSRRRIYWVHAVWIVNLFLYLVIAWWIFYRWRNQPQWTFLLFVFVLISPTILYLASLILFPPESALDKSIDYKTHFYANHRAFFILLCMYYCRRYLRQPPQRHSAFSCIRAAVLRQQFGLFRRRGDRSDHAKRTLPSVFCYLLFDPDHCYQLRSHPHTCVNQV